MAFSRVVNGDGVKRLAGREGGREDESGWELRRAGGREKGGLGGRLKERGRKAKAYPAVLHATANSRSDCNVRRFVDFDGARIRRCEAADVSLARDRRDLSPSHFFSHRERRVIIIVSYNTTTGLCANSLGRVPDYPPPITRPIPLTRLCTVFRLFSDQFGVDCSSTKASTHR